jgi:hypothetical protein
MQPFHFEHTRQFSEQEYIAVVATGISLRARPLKLVVIALVGIACLFWSYTMLLGLAVLVLVWWGSYGHVLFARGIGQRYRRMTFLRTAVAYGADQDGFWLHAAECQARHAWTQLHACRFSDEWVVLVPTAGADILLPVAGLKAARAYRPLLDTVARQGVTPNATKHGPAQARSRAA